MKNSSRTVLAFLAEKGPAYSGTISTLTGLNVNIVLGALTALRKNGYVAKLEGGWMVTEKGRERLEDPRVAHPDEPSWADRFAALEAQSDDLALTVADLIRRVQQLEETAGNVRKPAT